NFDGVARRFTKIDRINNNLFIDDYAHHPTEIDSVLSAAKQSQSSNNIIAVFQPHRYSRVLTLKKEFSKCFKKANTVLVLDIYAAGEKNYTSFKIKTLVNLIKNNSKTDTHYIESIDLVSKFLNSGKRNLVIFMGAGDISSQAVSFVNRQKEKS
ncbi:UDP-N-acetylmuramate--L-alanine ligase, partial [Pelagibacteraceae bacterium]|nr:UDP-N-acetylmuramate--L-alanine ligase [Pelagibacteraceae bacterium]